MISYLPTHTTHPLMEYNNVELNRSRLYRGISVSINTENDGEFGTSLERALSLGAAALEKEHKKGNTDVTPRVIYGWLDKIRQIVFEQRFDTGG